MGAILSTVGSCLGSCFGSAACSACKSCFSGVGGMSPKLGYSVLFILAVISTVVLREHGERFIQKLPWRGESEADGMHAALRAAQGPTLFHGALSLALMNTKYKGSVRSKSVHSGMWMAKAVLLLVLVFVLFWLPSDGSVLAFRAVARVMGGLFLVLQMIILVDFAYEWSENWASKEDDRWYIALLALTVAFYAAGVTLAGVMLSRFDKNHSRGCQLNIGLVSAVLCLTIAFIPLSLLPQSREGALFPSAIVSLYAMATLFSSLTSEPPSYECKGTVPGESNLTTYPSLAFTCLCVLYSTWRAGDAGVLTSDEEEGEEAAAGNESAELLSKEEEGESGNNQGADSLEDTQRPEYDYSLFHFIFATAFAYMAMLLTDWGTSNLKEGEAGIGWSSFTVKLVAVFAVVVLHAWTVVAPAILPDRDF